jgi:uncharacterized protein YbaP (TraB family)
MNLKNKRCFLVAILCIFLVGKGFSQSTTEKKYQSLLWEIKGKGLAKPSYLYGTMHVSDKMVFNLPDSFFVAIKNSSAVALEIDMDVWISEIMLMDQAEKIKNTTGYSSNVVGFYRQAFSIDAPDNDKLKSILQFSPNITNRLMYRTSKQNSDYEEDNYLDAFIFQTGKKLNKKIIGLENFYKTEELSRQADEIDYNLDDKVKEEIKDQKRLRLREILGDKSYSDALEDAYRRGDLDYLNNLYLNSSSEGFLANMLVVRNKIMVAKMDSVMQKSTLFTGVGAAHLPGKEGVIELLRNMGYSVRAISTAKADINAKIQIDETRFPTDFKTNYSPDSVFSVAVPGKLNEFKVGGTFKYYLCNDMSNGSYYCVQRLKHFGKLTNQNQDYLLKRIDSLIFENIPGKLLSKKEIRSNTGYPGIEILNKTAKGNYQKHRIFITPLEILAFKISGSQEYVNKGKEADNFFNSVKFYEPVGKFTTYQSKYGYSIQVPVSKAIVEVNSSENESQHEIISAVNNTDSSFVLMMSASLYDFDYIEEDSFELNMLLERFCLETNKIVISKSIFNKNNFPALQFKVESQNPGGVFYFGQIIIKGPDYYLLCSKNDSLGSLAYFNSLKFTDKLYSAPFKSIKDTTMYFSAKAQEIKNTYSDLLHEDNDKSYNLKKAKENLEKNEYLPYRIIKVYTSPETKEKVFVEYRKFSRYYQFETMDAFWKSRIDGLTDNNSFKASRVTYTKSGNTTECNLLLTDTGSVRGIAVKLIQKCGALHTLQSVVDTSVGLTGFAKTFFNSFAIKDTCIGIDVTTDKLNKYFFGKIYDKDTTQSKKAKAAIEYVRGNMLSGNVKSLIQTLENPDFNTLSANNKRDMISCFETAKSKETIPFLESFYAKYSDSVEVELAILRTLSRLKNKEATKSFVKMLRIDVPITANEYSISNVFSNFADSLQNAQWLFPEVLKYAKYPEYKTAVYKLMAQVMEEGYLKPKTYSKLLDDILLDANYELKKYISEKNRDKEAYRYSSEKVVRIYDELNTRQQKLYNYTLLLSPFYKNKDVEKYFNKLLVTSNNLKFKSVIYGQLIANSIEVHDTILQKLASSVSSRVMFYKVLKNQNNMNPFDKNYLNQKELVAAQLYGSSESFKKDTMVFLAVHNVVFDHKPGNVYVFKSKPKDKKIWKLGYSAIHPDDLVKINNNPQFTKTSFSFDSETQIQKEIGNLLRKIRVEKRGRASVKDFEKETEDYSDE